MAMNLKLEYEYDYVNADKILSEIKEFERNLKLLDKNIVCKNFQIKSNSRY